MITVENVYYEFRRAQAQQKGRGFRMPKDFEKHLNTKFSKKNKELLEYATSYFNTKWTNINISLYMDCGFELLKTFSYAHFLDPRVMNMYKHRDKLIKRSMKLLKSDMTNSMKFVKLYMKENSIESIEKYCKIKNGSIFVIIEHYLNNYIDKFFIVWLMKKRILKLDEDNLSIVPYISQQYREIICQFDDVGEFLGKLEKLL